MDRSLTQNIEELEKHMIKDIVLTVSSTCKANEYEFKIEFKNKSRYIKQIMSTSNDTKIISETMENAPESVPVKAVVNQETANEDVNEAESSVEAESSKTPTPVAGNVITDNTPQEFNRANVEALGNLVHLVDSDEENKLDMFCYVKCSESDSDLLKQCRGVVFNGDALVMKAFPYTIEYNHTETDQIGTTFENFDDWTFYESHEGALVRLFHFSGKWYVSTHRKLNAFRSKWASSESFGTLFKNALLSEEQHNEDFKSSLPEGENILERFQSTLDKSKQYMFLVRNNTENRIVCSVPERPTVFHVGTFVDGDLKWDENVNIPGPNELKFTDTKDLLDHVEKISYKDLQGVIAFDSKNKRVVKLFHRNYQDLFKARGNEPSVKFRYLQVRTQRRTTNMLYHLYPEKIETFDEYENTLFDIARSIYRSYVQRFIKKNYVTVPREEFEVIRECHSWHLSDRQNNRISIDKVIEVLNTQSPTHLNHMIRRYKLEQTRQKNQQISNRSRADSSCSVKSYEKSPVVRQIQTVPVSPLILAENTNPITTDAVKQKRPHRRGVNMLPQNKDSR